VRVKDGALQGGCHKKLCLFQWRFDYRPHLPVARVERGHTLLHNRGIAQSGAALNSVAELASLS